jgi:hypothetical protein
LGRNEINNNKTNQAKNEAAALKVKGKVEIEKKNEIFPDESYIPEDRIFAVIV